MRFLPRPATLLAALAVFILGAPLAAAPAPPRGEAVKSTLSLLRFQQESCDRIAGTVLEQWQGYGGSTEDQEERARDFVLKKALSDLAASRAAADIAVQLLPQVKSEANTETHRTLERLATAVKSLCDTVALPTGPLPEFQRRLTDALGLIEREETELGRLVVIPGAAALEAAIEPFLEDIQLAGLAAEAEYQQYIESLRPKKRRETFAEQVQAWHRTIYLPAVAPAKTAWGKYLGARQKFDNRGMSAACRELSAALIPLLRENTAFKGPDPQLEEPMRLLYVELRGLAAACNGGNANEMNRREADFNDRLQRLSAAMGRYGVSP